MRHLSVHFFLIFMISWTSICSFTWIFRQNMKKILKFTWIFPTKEIFHIFMIFQNKKKYFNLRANRFERLLCVNRFEFWLFRLFNSELVVQRAAAFQVHFHFARNQPQLRSEYWQKMSTECSLFDCVLQSLPSHDYVSNKTNSVFCIQSGKYPMYSSFTYSNNCAEFCRPSSDHIRQFPNVFGNVIRDDPF